MPHWKVGWIQGQRVKLSIQERGGLGANSGVYRSLSLRDDPVPLISEAPMILNALAAKLKRRAKEGGFTHQINLFLKRACSLP